ncbi:MAG: 16S rRNA (uracil(1498)-N(3))-methyltransferase [Oculatellaceae cyanobacterium Prado106]|jgi:16S rRNA (uracil1498-N3)-methyltransferase|nr:16S rRNA (uracil(1498)-N(3))-methyltransferase [Oculatellaceae cyanobacterium Prado106]
MTQLQRVAIQPEQIVNSEIHLTASQQHYLSRVLRLRPGDRFIALTGRDGWWLSELTTDPGVALRLEAIAIQTELPVSVTLLIGLPKTGMEDVVRQATELGVDQIVPILSDRTLLKPSPQKQERWQRIVQEAAEQSERQIIPVVQPPQSWPSALQTWTPEQASCYLCEARGELPHLLTCLKTYFGEAPQPPSSARAIVVATGPEGGWTPGEVEGAIAAGYQPVSLGAPILRAITAPLVALSLIAAVAGGALHQDSP